VARVTSDVIFGSCLCGSVRYEVRKPYLRFAHCYCGRCRKATGSSHATNLYVEPSQFSWLVGEHLTKRFDLPTAKSFATTVCTSCGGPLPHFTRSGREVVIPAGTLDTVPDILPQANIFWHSRASWSCSGGDIPSHAEYTPSWR
jgi:hypothetical protein